MGEGREEWSAVGAVWVGGGEVGVWVRGRGRKGRRGGGGGGEGGEGGRGEGRRGKVGGEEGTILPKIITVVSLEFIPSTIVPNQITNFADLLNSKKNIKFA